MDGSAFNLILRSGSGFGMQIPIRLMNIDADPAMVKNVVRKADIYYDQ
jgi:hypothetical protein